MNLTLIKSAIIQVAEHQSLSDQATKELLTALDDVTQVLGESAENRSENADTCDVARRYKIESHWGG